MNTTSILQETELFIRQKLEGEGTGHDWWHVHRVRNLALGIAEVGGGDLFIIEMAALLHDIADWKFHNGDDTAGPRAAREWMTKQQVNEEAIDSICKIIAEISFKGAKVPSPMSTLEGAIVQDADRLDAIGAIGIARTFAYGGHKNREIHNPEVKPQEHTAAEEYKSGTGSTINHFYEKLLLLKDLMNTATAKHLAVQRHEFMELFLSQFMEEWNGKQ